MKAVDTSLTIIGTAVDLFASSISDFQTAVDGAQSSVNELKLTIDELTTTITTTYNQYTSIFDGISIGTSVYFGIVIGLTVLGVVGLLLMTFCDKFKCRYLVYFTCVILFIIGIIGFLLVVVFSVFLPVIYVGCEFLTFSLATTAGFNANFGTLVDANTSVYITTCLPSGNGNIVDVLVPGIANSLNSLS